ncbi:hypothetical protein TPHA_0O00520 [Tetrapisispora phaffii CBS 4417]|uniref:Suppressor of forked domain-containing protein n=1 Tax=Tetrapisispora phaffii (strain ATCC 24235 / CBS 4417 / NBRC 1672 / NRRL Y-8282 / UCD 70-5) TaxID=1071381 RepID=G8C1J4_TETPH|nr:hypothetical protein TPHA_0O00520 [Tetrapisispora phaffii CBS 4417]CCE66022.1 hypothetical protein TPHA_0O00520 [Tetrapisispora phaffii CBS 4417]
MTIIDEGQLTAANALADLDSTFKDDNPELVIAYSNIQWDDIISLNTMVEEVEKVVLKYKSPNAKIKNSLTLMMRQLLQKYPLFFGYWKKYTAITYQLFGLDASIKVLNDATIAFPNSLELWLDYLNVLCANNPESVKLIREKFQAAKLSIGHQFMSDPFWDKYIEFETAHSEWEKLKDIYSELITYPIYHYAKYGIAYKKFIKLQRMNIQESNVDAQIKATQGIVNAIWKYENKIKQNFFNLTPVSKGELENWDGYLTFLVTNKKRFGFSLRFLQSVFERSLIPCHYYEYFWNKYLDFLKTEDIDNREIIETLYKGIKTLPEDNDSFRINYLSFLKDRYLTDKDFIFSTFQKTVGYLLRIWPNEIKLMTEYLSLLKKHKFPSDLNQSDKDILTQQTLYTSFLHVAIDNYLKNNIDDEVYLQRITTDITFPIIAVELIKMNWLVLKNTMQTIKLLTQFMKLQILKSSSTFWLTYYKFEKSSKNFNKLNVFVSQLGKEINLPTEVINDIMTDYQTFYLTNSNIASHQFTSSSRRKNNETSTYLFKKQIISYNKYGFNPNIKKFKRSEWNKQTDFKENGHLGIILDKPQITNSILEVQSKAFKNKPPSLPSFKNIDKLNQPIKYSNIISKEYIDKK